MDSNIKTIVVKFFTDKPVRKTPYQVKGVFIRNLYYLLLTLSASHHSSGRKSAFEIHEQPDRVELRMKYYTTQKNR